MAVLDRLLLRWASIYRRQTTVYATGHTGGDSGNGAASGGLGVGETATLWATRPLGWWHRCV